MKDNERKYGRYFLNFDDLFTEADDEETTDTETQDETTGEETPVENPDENTETEEAPTEPEPDGGNKPQYTKNTRVIEIKPNNRSKIKFDNLISEEDDETTGEETPVENPDENTETEEVPDDGMPDTTNEEIGTETDDGIEFNDDSTTDTGDGTTETPPDEPDTGGDEFTDDSMEDTSDDGDTTNTDQNAEGDKKGPGLEYDSTRKYNLYKNFVSLNNAINNYISKLENNLGEDIVTNQVYKKSTEKLREILELCNHYMIMKFEISTYVQSLLFYQNLVIMIQMVFDLIAKYTEKNKK